MTYLVVYLAICSSTKLYKAGALGTHMGFIFSVNKTKVVVFTNENKTKSNQP